MNKYRILCVGLGDLGSQMFDALVRVPGNHEFLVGGRNVDALRQRTNISLFAALQLGFSPHVSCTYLDLWDIEQTADTIARFRPDIIVCAATLLPWMTIMTLPNPFFKSLYPAMAGPWLPWPLVLVYQLMQAIHTTGLTITVINAAYPDVVNTVLDKVGLAPTIGIGNLANNIPGLRMSIALKLHVPVEHVEVRFIAEHYVSHHISRVGHAGGAPFHLTALVEGEDQTHQLEMEHIFDLLPTVLKRSGQGAGHLITAASAARIATGLVNDMEIQTHAPGPHGLPGGYPVSVSTHGVTVQLPDGLDIDQAIRLNEEDMLFDGIEKIDAQGTVFFAEKNMALLQKTLGYHCRKMPIAEVASWAKELQAKYMALHRL